ncbi:basic phospholipase A2 Sms-N6-like [Eublepharis macularius]|uniref:Phospholipase A2 n=1 Tax=Eublepharis macularius TaxID=481883 RepID=A0AA97KJS6_EUBMA|nr:basic phospholipase A2 Sms-N6-like [Eublepharis macularius]
MKILLGAIVLLACSILMAQGSILEFGDMIKVVTGKSAFPDYTTYGCYCGIGGKGRPRDATDGCCLAHDCCYSKLSEKCNTKTDRYKFTYNNGVVTCGQGSWCEMQTCECDKAAVLCLRDNLNSYNKDLRFYFDIHCNEGPMKC